MVKFHCSDYGYECEFVAEGDSEQATESFRTHMEEEHGIEYTKEAMQIFLLRK